MALDGVTTSTAGFSETQNDMLADTKKFMETQARFYEAHSQVKTLGDQQVHAAKERVVR